MMNKILAKDLASRLEKEELFLLDVRSAKEFEAMSIEGSQLQAVEGLTAEALSALSKAHGNVVLVCQSGVRAAQAFSLLTPQDQSHFSVLEGGLSAWHKAGLPVRQGKSHVSIERQVRMAAGGLVFVGVLLGAGVHAAWLAVPGFVGAGLLFSGITNTCGMAAVLLKMPWNR